MGATCSVQTYRNSCKFFSESDKKKLAMVISKIQVSDSGPSWPSCFFYARTDFLSLQSLHGGFVNVCSSHYRSYRLN